MTSLFVSYSRKDSAFAHKLIDAFKCQDWDFWIDWEDIPPTVNWFKEIEKGIEESGVFLFLISPDSVRSEYCQKEIGHAAKNGKRLIPIVVRDVNAEEVPSELCKLNWIFLRENDDFQSACKKLFLAVGTDYDWVRAHRQLQFKALEWERNNRDVSRFLRGTELQLAEFQLRTNASNDPHPTKLQQEYIRKSRRSVDWWRIIITGGVIGVVIALAVLGAFGWRQAGLATTAAQTAQEESIRAFNNEATAISNAVTAQAEKARADANEKKAEEQAKIALSRQLVAEALQTEQLDLALLLAIEASRDTRDGKLILSNLLRVEPHLIRIVNSEYYLGQGEEGFITSLALSRDGNQLVAQSYSGAGFWDFSTHKMSALKPEEYQQYLDDWKTYQIPSPDAKTLLPTLEIKNPDETSSAVANRAAFSSCRTMPSAGGAPGCTSLIYIVSAEFERLITPLQGCSPNQNDRGFDVRLEGGLYSIQNLKGATDHPADFELYSAALANVATNQRTALVDALYHPQTNRMVTAAKYDRFQNKLSLIVWDLNDKKPILELFYRGIEQATQIKFSDSGKRVDVCILDIDAIQVDIDPQSWQQQACEMAGRNFTRIEWAQYFPGNSYPTNPKDATCPQWPLESEVTGTPIMGPQSKQNTD